MLVILASVAGFVAPRPASACSCIGLDPGTGLAEHPAAFVGTLVDSSRGGEIGGFPIGDGFSDAVYRFEVEQWVKGDLGDVVDVHSAADGAACGIEVGIGNRAGVFLTISEGKLTSSLCATMDADVLLAGAEPLEIGAAGPGVLLVAGNVGGFDYVILNSAGEIVNGVNGPFSEPFEQPWNFASCPGDRTIVEQWSRALVVRDLSDLSVVRQIDLGDYADTTSFSSIRCLTDDGSSLLLAGEEFSGDRPVARLFTVGDSIEAGIELPPGQTWLSDEFAVVQNYESNEIWVVALADGEQKLIHAVDNPEPDSSYVGISSVSISPETKSIALVEVNYDGPDGTKSTLVHYGHDGTQLGEVTLDGEIWWTYWLDDDRLIVSASLEGGAQTAWVLSATDLDTIFEIPGWQGSNPVIVEDVMYASDGGSIVTADLTSGTVDRLTVLPAQWLGPLAPLPSDFVLSPELGGEGTQPNVPVTVPPLVSDEFSPGEVADVTGTARVILGVLVVSLIATIAVAMYRRRSLHEPPATTD